MKERPLILVTNDDGITAPGVRALIEVMNEIGDVFVDGDVGVLLLAIELEDGKLRDFIVKKFHNEPFNILLIAID